MTRSSSAVSGVVSADMRRNAQARRRFRPARVRQAAASLVLCAVPAASLFVTAGQAAAPLSIRLSAPEMIGPGQMRVDAEIAGFDPDLRPTIQLSVQLGVLVREGSRFPVVAAHLPYTVDFATGAVRVGGVLIDRVAPLPPLQENADLSVTATVRQGGDAAGARATTLLVLPTVVIPGYLNDLGGGQMDTVVAASLARRGFSASGASPTLFWFGYHSRTLPIDAAAQELVTYVQTTVLPATYAAKVNLVGYSLGGLIARWAMAFQPGWDQLIDRFVMIGVPNEGAVLPYLDAWYAIGGLARTPAARDLLPTFPFWRANSQGAWTVPAGSSNDVLAALNRHPLPAGVRAYSFYGDNAPARSASRTVAGVTGAAPRADVSYGPGDGIVLVASALGLPVNGGPGVPGIDDRLALMVDLGPVGHVALLEAASGRVGDALVDREIEADPFAPAAAMAGQEPNADSAQSGAARPDGMLLQARP